MSNPPNIDHIGSTDDLRSLVEQVRESQTKLADYLATVATAAHPDIVELLNSYGFGIPGRMPFSSTGSQRTADTFVKLAKRTADQAIAVAKTAEAMYLHWLKQVKQPVDAAEAARSKSGPRIKV